MKRSTLFLQCVIVLVGLGALAFLLGEPHFEGRNRHATPFEVYFHDPMLAYVYLASIPFFMGLYQAFKVLGYAGRETIFSPAAVKAMRTIKYCALVSLGFVAVSVVFLPFGDPEDRPPGVMMRILVSFLCIVVATAAAMCERILQSAVAIKSEHDLTV